MKHFIVAILCAGLLAGCSTPVAPLAPDQTAVIPGSLTADQNAQDATRTVLLEAARITVDHGFQYFGIVGTQGSPLYMPAPTIRPGVDVTIKVYQEANALMGGPGLWDANKILESGVSDNTRATAAPLPVRPSAPGARPVTCTAYGCVW